MRQWNFLFITGGFLLGTFVHSLLGDIWINAYTWVHVLFAIGAISIIVPLLSRKFKNLLSVGLFCVVVALGIVRYDMNIDMSAQTILHPAVHQDSETIVEGVIVSDPEERISSTRFKLRADSIYLKGDIFPIDTGLLITTDNFTTYQYGDRIRVTGNIEIPKPFETDTGRVFHYDNYLAKDDIFYTMRYVNAQHISSDHGSVIRSAMFQLKNKLVSVIYRWLPEPESLLMSGILFGEKTVLDGELEDDFRRAGLVHIVVLSGYNIAVVVHALVFLFRFLPLPVRTVLAVSGIVLFAILTGAGPTVIRASIMALLIVLAKFVGRAYDIRRALIMALLIMVIINPKILYFDISFQLSFLATYGLIAFAPYLENKFKWIPTTLEFRGNAIATIAAQIWVLPLLLYSIGEFPVISILVNVLVLFAVPWAMFFGFIMSLVGLFSGSLASLLAYPTYFLLKYQIVIVEFFGNLSFATFTIPPFPWWLMVLMYVGIFWWTMRIYKKQSSQ